MKSLEETIEILREDYGAEITKGDYYYNVIIWDSSEGVMQDLDLTDSEVIDLLEFIEG